MQDARCKMQDRVIIESLSSHYRVIIESYKSLYKAYWKTLSSIKMSINKNGSISLETARNGEFGDLPREISSSPEGNLQPLWETLFSIKTSIKSLIRLL